MLLNATTLARLGRLPRCDGRPGCGPDPTPRFDRCYCEGGERKPLRVSTSRYSPRPGGACEHDGECRLGGCRDSCLSYQRPFYDFDCAISHVRMRLAEREAWSQGVWQRTISVPPATQHEMSPVPPAEQSARMRLIMQSQVGFEAQAAGIGTHRESIPASGTPPCSCLQNWPAPQEGAQSVRGGSGQ
jgi:hypothetical protein